MDINKLKRLKELSVGLSVLYVEDSLTLQKQVSMFLNKIFDTVYQSFDGEDALLKYKELKPDLVLTDLTMPKKNGIELIKDIKQIDEDAKIIVLSAHNDDDVLHESINLKVIDFILKPLDVDKLIKTFTHAIQNDQLDNNDQTLHDLDIIYKQKGHVGFLNYYKGIPVENEGQIIDISDHKYVVKIPHIQILAINYEKHTILELKSIHKYMKLDLLKIDQDNDIIVLENPLYIDYTLRNIKNKRCIADKSFKLGIHFHNKHIESKVLDISYVSIAVFIEKNEHELKVDDNIDLTLGFDVDGVNGFNYEKKFSKIFAKGTIIRIDSYEKGFKLVSTLTIEKSDETIFNKYIHMLELETINELKVLNKKQ